MLFECLLNGSTILDICHASIIDLLTLSTQLDHLVYILGREDHYSIDVCDDDVVRIDCYCWKARRIWIWAGSMYRYWFLKDARTGEWRLPQRAVPSREDLGWR